jgi:hypothetical protein
VASTTAPRRRRVSVAAATTRRRGVSVATAATATTSGRGVTATATTSGRGVSAATATVVAALAWALPQDGPVQFQGRPRPAVVRTSRAGRRGVPCAGARRAGRILAGRPAGFQRSPCVRSEMLPAALLALGSGGPLFNVSRCRRFARRGLYSSGPPAAGGGLRSEALPATLVPLRRQSCLPRGRAGRGRSLGHRRIRASRRVLQTGARARGGRHLASRPQAVRSRLDALARAGRGAVLHHFANLASFR